MGEEKKDSAENNRRTQVNDLPREEKDLTAEEQKQVQGGLGGGEGGWPAFNKPPAPKS